MKKLKITSLVLGAFMLVGCGTANADSKTGEENVVEQNQEVSTEFVLEHTDDLKALGFEDIVMEEEPERIVLVMSSAFHTLNNLGVTENIIATVESSSAKYPEDLNVEMLPSPMGGNVDTEKILSLEPDLVIFPQSSMETGGQILIDAGIEVYAMAMADMSGEKNTYEYTKEQTELFVEAFATTDEKVIAGEEILGEFEALEDRVEEFKANNEPETYLSTMVVSETDSYINTSSSIIGTMLDMFGYENLYEELAKLDAEAGHGSAPVDLEMLVDIETDKFIFLTMSGDQAVADQTIEDMIANNEAVWNIVPAVGNGDYVVLTSNYFVSAGILIVDNMNALLDVLESTN